MFHAISPPFQDSRPAVHSLIPHPKTIVKNRLSRVFSICSIHSGVPADVGASLVPASANTTAGREHPRDGCVDSKERQTYNLLTGWRAIRHWAGKSGRKDTVAAVRPGYRRPRASSYTAGVFALAGMVLAAALSLGCAMDLAAPLPAREETAAQPQGDLTVFAAASLSQALEQMAEAFEEAHPGASVIVNYDGSQRLRTQLEHGAQADVFAPADWEQMEAVAAAGLIDGRPVNFARNQPVFLVNSDFARRWAEEIGAGSAAVTGAETPGAVTLKDLARPGVKIVLALPEAPIGRYSEAVINRMGGSPLFGPDYPSGLLNNVVSRETNVRSVAQKVALGEADAGITYRTDALSPYVAQRVRVLTIPASLNITAHYPIAPLREAAQPEQARAFIDFVRSLKGRAILERYGFEPPRPAATGAP